MFRTSKQQSGTTKFRISKTQRQGANEISFFQLFCTWFYAKFWNNIQTKLSNWTTFKFLNFQRKRSKRSCFWFLVDNFFISFCKILEQYTVEPEQPGATFKISYFEKGRLKKSYFSFLLDNFLISFCKILDQCGTNLNQLSKFRISKWSDSKNRVFRFLWTLF